jgi:hypothetical protein
MENQQAITFLASMIDVIVKAVKTEVLESLDKDALVSKAIHSAVDYDETFWQRITDHVNKQITSSSGEPVESDDFVKRVDACIENWSDTYLDDKVGDWMDSYLNDRIDTWMNDNFTLDDYADIDDKVKDIIRNDLSFSVSVD